MLTAIAVMCGVLALTLALQTLLQGVLFWYIHRTLKGTNESSVALLAASSELRATLKELPEIAIGMDQAKEAVQAIPGLLIGLREVTKEQVNVMMGVKRGNDKMHKLMFSGEPEEPTVDEDADRLLQNHPEMEIEEARSRAGQNRQLKGFKVTQA